MTDLWIGIDPGKTGGLVILDRGGRLVGHSLMPVVGKGTKRSRPSLALLLRWLEATQDGIRYRDAATPHETVTVAIERVSSAPSDGVVSAFSFGRSLQVCFDFAEAIGAATVEISPKDWQRTFLRGHRKGSREQIKASAALVAGERWPELTADLQVKARWGLADAALIAATARLASLTPPSSC